MTATLPVSRDHAAELVMEALAAACPAGQARSIGSMARPDAADAFSDIDLRWSVPSDQACQQLQALRETLQGVGDVESLRVDPEPRSDEMLVFVRFRGWPL